MEYIIALLALVIICGQGTIIFLLLGKRKDAYVARLQSVPTQVQARALAKKLAKAADRSAYGFRGMEPITPTLSECECDVCSSSDMGTRITFMCSTVRDELLALNKSSEATLVDEGGFAQPTERPAILDEVEVTGQFPHSKYDH